MRAFDFVGIVEAVKEVRRKLEEAAQSTDKKEAPTFEVPMDEIPDSEDEEDEHGLDKSTDAGDAVKGNRRECSWIIVVDTITNVVNAELARNQAQGKHASQSSVDSTKRVLGH